MAYTNYGYESRLTGLRQRLGLTESGVNPDGSKRYVQGQSQIANQYNPGRLRLATETGRGLTDNRLYERASAYETGRTDDGSVAYGVNGQFEGQAYRDMYSGINDATGARGSSGSSAAARMARLGSEDLNNQRDSILRGFGDQQAQSFEQQQAAQFDYADQLAQTRGEYTDWQGGRAAEEAERVRQEQWQARQDAMAAQPASDPYSAPAPEPEQPATPSPATPAGKKTYTLGGGISKASLARARQAQAQRPGYKLERRGGSFVLVRR